MSSKSVFQLHFLGHAAFDLRMGDMRFCLDPHKPGALGGRFHFPEIQGPFDAIVHTHAHEDHSAWTPALGTTRIVDGDCDVGSVQLRVRPAFHDAHGGKRMGLVRMVSLQSGALRVVHCGDIAAWNDRDVGWLKHTDVLLVPVGGTYTLNGDRAAELVRAVQPRVCVPMHAADRLVDLPLDPIADFMDKMNWPTAACEKLESPLPQTQTVCVMLRPE